MFSVRFAETTSAGSVLDKLAVSLSDLQHRLDSRQKVAPSVFSAAMKLREETHHLGECQLHYSAACQSHQLAGGSLWHELAALQPPVVSCHDSCRRLQRSLGPTKLPQSSSAQNFNTRQAPMTHWYLCLAVVAPYSPVGSIDVLFPGTWYLTAVDDKHRRTYDPSTGRQQESESQLAEPVRLSPLTAFTYRTEFSKPHTSAIM